MGRFYSGDISGKFWFGVQSSDDISELVSYIPIQNYIWKACGCYVDEDIPLPEGTYCKGCYDSIDAHILEVKEEENYDDELLYGEDQEFIYELDTNTHYRDLLDSMNELKQRIHPDIMSEFDKIEQNDNILDAFSGVFNHIHEYMNKNNTYDSDTDKHKECQLLARYTLGYQIEYCLRTTDTCNIACEY
jgi:hypothetical protein